MTELPDLLSPHFLLADFTSTSTGLPNALPAGLWRAAQALHVRVLEQWRTVMGYAVGGVVKVREDSGYRSLAVNTAIRGSQHSQHMRAQAADCVPVGRPLRSAFEDLVVLAPFIPLGQAILYWHTGFIHVSVDLPPNFHHDLAEGEEQPTPPDGWAPRRELWVCVDPARKAPLVAWADWQKANP